MAPRATFLALIVGLLVGCSPKPGAPPVPTRVAAPPKLVKMICRNSQSGKTVECGTPNAVMVGMADK